MALQRLYKSSEIEIDLDEAERCLYVNWIGFQLVDSVKNGCEKMLDFVRQYHCSKVLNDNTNVRGIWAGAAEWGATDWFPRMKEAGVKYFAWVYSPSFYSKMSTDVTIENASEELLANNFIRTFFDYKEAQQWLQEVDSSAEAATTDTTSE